MRTTVLWALCVILIGGMLVRVNAEETREARIRRLTQEALTLRKEGRLDDAKERLTEAERELAGTPAQVTSAATPPQTAAEPQKNAGTDMDPGKAFAQGLAAMAANDLDTAAQKFQTVVRLDPNSFEAHNNLAVIYAEQGKEENALVELRAALHLRPDYYRGRKNLAELYTRLASRAYKEAASVAPVEDRTMLLERGRELAGLSQTEIPVTKAPAATSPQHTPATTAVPPLAVGGATPPGVSVAAASANPTATVPAVPEGKRPKQFLALGPEGASGIVIDGSRLWLYQQKSIAVRAVRSFSVKAAKTMPDHDTLYVATLDHSRINLIPLVSGARSLTLRSSGNGSTSVTIDGDDLKAVAGVVDSYLTPVLVTPHVDLVDDAQDQNVRSALATAFQTWSESWDKKKVDPYVASYVPTYAPEGERSHDSWRQQRQRIFSLSGNVSVEHSTPVILPLDGGAMTLSKQQYHSDLQVSTGVKSLTWTSTPSGWRITKEQMLSERIGSDGH